MEAAPDQYNNPRNYDRVTKGIAAPAPVISIIMQEKVNDRVWEREIISGPRTEAPLLPAREPIGRITTENLIVRRQIEGDYLRLGAGAILELHHLYNDGKRVNEALRYGRPTSFLLEVASGGVNEMLYRGPSV
jgi:hypothetical protein